MITRTLVSSKAISSCERVRRAVLFEGPDRVPCDLPPAHGSDFMRMGVGPAPSFALAAKNAPRWEDEWGCVWEKAEHDQTMGRITRHPLEDYGLLPDYKFPALLQASRYKPALNPENKFALATLPVYLLQTVEDLRGPENAWTDPVLYPEELERLLDQLADMLAGMVDRFADLGAHGIFIFDDWGLQDRLMLAPDVFRRFWKPRYARVFARAHARNLLTFMHSCGYIVDILDDLIEVGLNVIQMDQQANMGLKNLGRRFGGRLCFWCPVDIQAVMPVASLLEIRAYARELIDTLGGFNGGFIAKWYPAPAAVGHTPEQIQAMCEEFINYGGVMR